MESKGYQILEMNFRCRMGEIDMVAKDGEYLCFIEVKYRTSDKAGTPEEAVDRRKQQRICRVADYYFFKHKLSSATSVRFDVVAISQQNITLYKNAFYYREF